MFIKKISLSVGLCGLLWASSTLAANDPNSIMGYSASKASPAFHTYLVENAEAFVFFAVHTSELKYVLENPDIQQKLASGKMTLEELDGDIVEEEDESDSRAASDLSTIAGADVRSDIKDTARRNLRNIGKDSDSINVDKEVDRALNAPVRTIKNPDARSGGTDRESPGTGGTDREGPVMNPVVTLPKPIDMNALPVDNQAKDANGWPKYLNVPASCPKPEAGTKYIHDFAFGNPRPNGSGTAVEPQWSIKNNAVSPWFKRLGDWFYLSMTDKETYSIPFYSGYLAQPAFPYTGDDTGGAMRFSWEVGGGIQTTRGAPQFEVSECPGKFPTPASDTTTASGFTGVGGFGRLFMYKDDFNKAYAAATPSSQPGLQSMRLEPGKRYFLNVRQGNRNCDAISGEGTPKRDGHAICANEVTTNGTDFYGTRSRPPYAGPCLSQAPYPANYDSRTCQENMPTCGENNKLDSIRILCQDALGKAPEQKYEATCVGDKLRWTQGAGKPGFDSYVCVGDWHQKGVGEVMSWDAMPTYKLCSRENEGGKRVLKAIFKRGQTPTTAAEITQTCVFDEKEVAGIYRWKQTSSSGTANPDWSRMYQSYNDYTLQSYWYDKEGNLVGENSVH